MKPDFTLETSLPATTVRDRLLQITEPGNPHSLWTPCKVSASANRLVKILGTVFADDPRRYRFFRGTVTAEAFHITRNILWPEPAIGVAIRGEIDRSSNGMTQIRVQSYLTPWSKRKFLIVVLVILLIVASMPFPAESAWMYRAIIVVVMMVLIGFSTFVAKTVEERRTETKLKSLLLSESRSAIPVK